jgi:cyclase
VRRLIPLLQVYEKELYKSKLFDHLRYIGDPFVAVKIFNELQAMEIIIADTTPAKKGSTLNTQLIGQIASECFMPVTYAGGIKDVATAGRILSLGVEKLCIASAYHQQPQFIKELVKEFGTSTIVACIELKNIKGKTCVTYHSGTKVSSLGPEECIKKLQDDGIGEILVYDLDRDGTMQGGNNEWVQKRKATFQVPLIYAGGIGNAKDSLSMFESGASAVAVGSSFVYKGRLNGVLINYPDHRQMPDWTGEQSFLLKKF